VRPIIYRFGLTAEIYIDLMNIIEATRAKYPGSILGVQNKGWSSPKGSYSRCVAVSFIQDFLFGKSAHQLWDFDVWFNVVPEGGLMTAHDHNQAVYSAIIHFTKGSSLVFPRIGVEIDPVPGQIVLFDSTEQHLVCTHHSAAPRISMAMNATPKTEAKE